MCSKSKMLILTSQGEPAPLPYLCIPLPTPVFLQNALGSLAMLTSIYWSNQTSHSSLHPWFQCCAQIIHTFGLNKRRAADGINWNQMESIGIRWNQLESDGIKYSTPLGWTNAERQMELNGIRWNFMESDGIKYSTPLGWTHAEWQMESGEKALEQMPLRVSPVVHSSASPPAFCRAHELNNTL